MSSPADDVQFLNQLCQQLYDTKTPERFNYCKLVRACLSDQRNLDAIKNDIWPRLVRDSVAEMFRSRLTDAHREEALHLTTQMTLLYDGMSWVKCEDTWDVSNSKILILLLRLVCIEVQIILPRLLDDEAPPNSQIGSLLILMEKLLFAFINNLNEDEDDITGAVSDVLVIDSSMIVTSIDAVRIMMREVIDFIKALSLQKDPLSADLKNLLYANIRILCFYMSEEPDELKELIAEVLPFILKTVKHNVEMSEINVVEILKVIYDDDTSKAIMLRHGVDYEKLDDYLS